MNQRPRSVRDWRRKRASAQSLVELALVTPLMIMLLVGVFEFGLILYAHVQVSNAAREAARAASLYSSTRFITVDGNNVPNCVSGVNGWSLSQTVQQAIVYYDLDSKGCPGTTKMVSSSLGWLDPKPSTMWTVTITPGQTGSATPTPGTQATVTLRYPYKLQVISNLFAFFSDPMWIEKSVKFEYQGY